MGIFTKKTATETTKKDSKIVEKNTKDLTIEEITNEKKDNKKQVKQHVAKTDTKNAYKILVKPLITEKAAYLKAENKYLFEVSMKATKNEVKKAVFHVYGVWPSDVNIIISKGKEVRYGKHHGKTKDRKKAMVTLKKGDAIEIYEGV